jgi:hypothetical protein
MKALANPLPSCGGPIALSPRRVGGDRVARLDLRGSESEIVQIDSARVSRGKQIVEAGANGGQLTVSDSRATSAPARSVEPHPMMASVLPSNVALNGLSHADVVEAADEPTTRAALWSWSCPMARRSQHQLQPRSCRKGGARLGGVCDCPIPTNRGTDRRRRSREDRPGKLGVGICSQRSSSSGGSRSSPDLTQWIFWLSQPRARKCSPLKTSR